MNINLLAPTNRTLPNKPVVMNAELKVATFGAGCFWCIETIFSELKGVKKVVSGYMGGHGDNPTYKQVCTGTTGYAEVCQITYDPNVISYSELLQVFWKVHDPTTLNSQGADHGTQYRSVIYYHNDEQKKQAEFYKKELEKTKAYDAPIVTEIAAASKFYPAEAYHQNYYALNGSQPYCKFVIQPKVEKFKKAFATKLKK
jgi:peptide-methionine (S)-S-oxide reductase